MCPETVAPAPAVTSNPDHPALVFVIVMLIVVGLFELWAAKTGHSTISQWVQHVFSGHAIWQIVGIALMTLFGIHLFRGF
jgi:hypothetical protein